MTLVLSFSGLSFFASFPSIILSSLSLAFQLIQMPNSVLLPVLDHSHNQAFTNFPFEFKTLFSLIYDACLTEIQQSQRHGLLISCFPRQTKLALLLATKNE
jgi:hypothetical protein